MRKIVINRKPFGVFSLSKKATDMLWKLKQKAKNTDTYVPSLGSLKRDDPDLIKVIETLGSEAHDTLANLKIVQIPCEIIWEIEEYNGMEWVGEKHKIWC